MINRNSRNRRPIKAAESYGWVVESLEANEAYEKACEAFGEEEVNAQIVGTLGSDELAECLAFLFRMWDFREWDERNEEDEDEDYEDEYDESEDYE